MIFLVSLSQSAAKFEPSAQQLAEKDRLLSTLQEEVSIAKGKVKQLSQVSHLFHLFPDVSTRLPGFEMCGTFHE